ncbi:MAG: lipoate--protein ligase [Dysgonamonadaceae bacterium]|nr:lipoate--protein ligase [Dysgonamonadaceae bacterium]MDD4730135.1 lipoate--protein ligase [Dysgonamonadaceae bacterium]
MLILRSRTTNPAFNLATEEFLLKNKSEDCFYLYINNPSIIVGRNQNALAEINVHYVKENNIDVIRRQSGGGAVFHDPGNLNFTFIMTELEDKSVDFRKYTQPILDVLKSLGVDAKFEGRNDMTIKGKKFSGNAKYFYKDKILQHGTLLFSSTLPNLSQALKLNPLKYRDKAVKSISSRVTNISEHLSYEVTLQELEERIINHVRNMYNDSEIYELTDSDIDAINKLVEEKYGTWDWNFGHSPQYNFQKGIKTNGGHIEINLEVIKGEIKNAKIFGDFFNIREVSELENLLIGTTHEQEHIKKLLETVGIENYLSNVTVDEFVEGLF